MVKWLKRISILFVFILFSGVLMVGCTDLYDRLSISVTHESGTATSISLEILDGASTTYDITAIVSGNKKQVSDKIRYTVENGSNLTITSDYKGDGKTVLTITATSHGQSILTLSTLEGNKSVELTINVYKKVESVSFGDTKLAIKKNGTLNLNNYVQFNPTDTDQTGMTFSLMPIDEFAYTENYASISTTGVLTVDPNATLPVDADTGLPYVTIQGISTSNDLIKTEIINVAVIDLITESNITLRSNSNSGVVTLVKNANDIYHVVLASNIGFTNTEGANSILFSRRLFFVLDKDQSKYDISIDPIYLESYQLNNNLTSNEQQTINDLPVLMTELDSDSLLNPTFDVTQKQTGMITIPFYINYSEYEGLPEIVINVKFEVLAFPTSISAKNNNMEITESNPLKVLNIYSGNLNGTPLSITTNNDSVSSRLYYTFKVDKGNAPTNEIVVATSNPNNVYSENTNILTGTTLYIYHKFSSNNVEDISGAYLEITYTYDLNPASITGSGEGAVIGNFSYSITYNVPLTFRAGISEIPLESSTIRLDASNPQETLLLETQMGVFANEFTYNQSSTNLFTLRIEKYETYITANSDSLSGEFNLIIRDSIRNLYRTCKVIVYVPFAYIEDDSVLLSIENPNNYADELLSWETKEGSVTLNTSNDVSLVRTYDTLSSLNVQMGSVIPINAYNFIFNPLMDSSEIQSDDDLIIAAQNYVNVINMNQYIESVSIPYRYGSYKDGYLTIGTNTYTNTESPLALTFIFTGYNSAGEQVTIRHTVDLLIYSLINNLSVSVINSNIYEYNSVGALNGALASSVITVNNTLNNASTIEFNLIDKLIKSFNTISGQVDFYVEDLFQTSISSSGKYLTITALPTGSEDEVGSGVAKLQSLLSDYGSVNKILSEIYATNFKLDVIVTLTQFNRTLSQTVTLGTIYAVKAERIVLSNINSTGIYFDVRDLTVGDKKDIYFSIEPNNAFNKKVRLIYDANGVFSCTLNTSTTSNYISIYPLSAGESVLRIAFEDSYEEIVNGTTINYLPTNYIEVRIKVADGSVSYPFEIANVSDFGKMIRDINNDANSFNYVLTNDINLSGYNYVIPTNSFNGSLNGLFEYELDSTYYSVQNSLINLGINVNNGNYTVNSGANNIGLFGNLSSTAIIKNLIINNANITVNLDETFVDELNVGIFAGINSGMILNSKATGSIQVTAFGDLLNVGGFAGKNTTGVVSGLPSSNNGLGDSDINSVVNIQITRLLSVGDVTSLEKTNVGGLLGYIEGKFNESTLQNVGDIINVNVVANIIVTAINRTFVANLETGLTDVVNTTNTSTSNINLGGFVGYLQNTKMTEVISRVVKLNGVNNIGGLLGKAVNLSLQNAVVQFVNNGSTGLSASNIIGYSNLGGLIGYSEGDNQIEYSYVRSFYNKTITDIDNSSYYGNLVSLKEGSLVGEVNVGGLVGVTFNNLDVENNVLFTSIKNSYAILDINTSVYGEILSANNNATYHVGGLIGKSTISDTIENSYVLSNILMPQALATTITLKENPLIPGENEGEMTYSETPEDVVVDVPSFGYFTGAIYDGGNKLTGEVTATSYSVVNRDTINDKGFFAYSDLNNILSTSEIQQQVSTEYEGETFTLYYLFKEENLINGLNELNGFTITTDVDYHNDIENLENPKIWYQNDLLNEGFPVLFDSNYDILYTILPSSISAIVQAEPDDFTNNSHIQISSNTVILFYNILESGTSYVTNNTYKIIYGEAEDNGINYNNVIQVNLGIDNSLLGIVDVESGVIVESSNESILSVTNGNVLTTKGEGTVTLSFTSILDPTIHTSVTVMVLKGLSNFNLYEGSVSDKNLISTSQELIIDKVYKYTVGVINKSYNGGIAATYEKNSDIGYIISSDEYNYGVVSTSSSTNDILESGKSYLYNSVGNINLVGFTSGDVNLSFTPVLFTGNPAFGTTIYLDGSRILTEVEVASMTEIELNKLLKYEGVVVLSKLEKDYTFAVIEKARSLSLNNNTGTSILPTGLAELNISIITSAFTYSNDEYNITEKLNVIVYANGTEVGLRNIDGDKSDLEYLEGKYKAQYNDSLISYEFVERTFEVQPSGNQIKLNYKIYLSFDQEKYLDNAGNYSLNELIYNMYFYPRTNVELNTLNSSMYTFQVVPQTIQQIYSSFYPSGQTTVTDQFNPIENSTDYIAPSRYGLLTFNVYPKFNNADYYEIEVPYEYRKSITITQSYAIYDSNTSNAILKGYQNANPGAIVLSDYMGIRLYNISNTFSRFDGNFYVRVLLSSSIEIGAELNFTIHAYKNGEETPVFSYTTETLTVSPLPGITASIEGKTSNIIVAKTHSKVGEITATEFSGDISYEISSTKSSLSNYSVTITGNTFVFSVANGALGGDNVTITFSVSKMINGIQEQGVCSIYIVVVEYEILSVQVEDSALNDVGENQLDLLNGVTKLLSVNINARIDESNSNLLASLRLLEKNFAGQGVSYNNWYRKTSYSSDPTSNISLNIVGDSGSLIFTHYEFIKKENNGGYYVKAIRISDINVLCLSVSYYYDSNGIARMYHSDLLGEYKLFELEYTFRIKIKDNSTYDHPNPIYSYEDIATMQSGSHYVLMNNITIDGLVPFSANDFASLDGNGYTITINSFNLSKYKGLTTQVNIGLFETISSGTIIKNLNIDVSNLLISSTYMATLINSTDENTINAYSLINASKIARINFGLIAGTNSGTLSNIKVFSTANTANNYLFVYTTQSKIDNITPSAYIGGLVGINNGIITNSFIGINDSSLSGNIVYEGVSTSGTNTRSTTELNTYPFRLSGSNNIAGLAYANSGKIISAYVNGMGIINTSLLGNDDAITAGFVASNEANGLLSNVFVQGTFSDSGRFRANEDYRVESKGNMGGLVYSNSGEIKDAFSNIAIKTNSKRSGGFVFINNASGTITNAYSTAKNSIGSRAHGAFIGTNEIGESNNLATANAFTSIYYLVLGDEYINESEVATPIKSTGDTGDGELGTDSSDPFLYAGSFNGFSFSVGNSVNSVWIYTDSSKGPQLISCVYNDTYSNRVLSSTIEETNESNETTYTYNYDYISDGFGDFAVQYGQKNNPLLVRNASEFVNFIINNSNGNNIFGGEDVTVNNVRLIDNIDLSTINLNEYKVDEKLLSNIIFNGVLDGNSLNVTGINLLDNSKGTPKEEYGLFKQIGLDNNDISANKGETSYNALIKNVTFSIDQLVATNVKLVGTLAGKVVNTTLINVHVEGKNVVIQGLYVAGGVAGIISGNSSLINVTSNASISSVYRTQVRNITDVLANFNYDYTQYSGDYATSFHKTLAQLNNTELKTYSSLFGYAGGIAGIIDVTNDTELDNFLYYMNDENENNDTFGLNKVYRTDEPTSPIIRDLKVYDEIIISGESAGGLFGYVGSNTRIYDSLFELSETEIQEINGIYYSGGITAVNEGVLEKVRIEHIESVQKVYDNNIVNGNVQGTKYLFKSSMVVAIGGIAGLNSDAVIIDSYSKVNVYNKNSYIAGGVVGKNIGYAKLDHVYSTGLVYAGKVMGGIFGYINASQYAYKEVNYIGYRYYPVVSKDTNGNTIVSQPLVGAVYLELDRVEQITLSNVAALNTWNTETNSAINDNFKTVYSYATGTGSTEYYSYKNTMPEIGNEYVDQMFKVVTVTEEFNGEIQTFIKNVYETYTNKEITGDNLSLYEYSYSKNIGSIVGRLSSIGSNLNFEYITYEVGADVKSHDTYGVGVLDVFNISTTNSINDGVINSIKELSQLDVSVYSNVYGTNNLSNASLSAETYNNHDGTYSQEYNHYNYINYLGWQRNNNYLTGDSIEINTENPEDKSNLVENNIFNNWLTISDSDTEKVFKINEESGIPEYIEGIYSNLIEIENSEDWNEYIGIDKTTRNKFYTIVKNISLNYGSINYGTFEGTLIGNIPNSTNSTPTVTVNVSGSDVNGIFDLITSATISNVDFVINLTSTNGMLYNTANESIGLFTNKIYNSTITNCSFTINYGNRSHIIRTNKNSYMGSVFGSVVNTNIRLSQTLNNSDAITIYNLELQKINLNQNIAFTFGAFAGFVNNSTISYLPVNFESETPDTLENVITIQNERLRITKVTVGGLIGYSVNTNYSNISLTKLDNDIQISTSQLSDVIDAFYGVIDTLYVGGLFGMLENGFVKNVSYVGDIYVGATASNATSKAYITNINVGGAVGYLLNGSMTNVSSNITFDDENEKPVSLINGKYIKANGYNNTTTGTTSMSVGGLVGYFKTSTINSDLDLKNNYTESASNTNISVTNNYKSSNNYVGGIVGYVSGSSDNYVAYVFNVAIIIVNNNVVGYTGRSYVGGIVGIMQYGSIERSYNMGNIEVISTNYYAGGILGGLLNSISNTTSEILYCISYADFEITTSNSNARVGGILGYNQSQENRLLLGNCISMSRVNGVNNNDGYMDGIGANYVKNDGTSLYYIDEFSPNSIFSTSTVASPISYGSFGTEITNEFITISEVSKYLSVNYNGYSPIIKGIYTFYDVLPSLNTEGTKYNPIIIKNSSDNYQIENKYYVVQASIKITSALGNTFTGLISSTQSSTIQYTGAGALINKNEGILSGIILNITGNLSANNSYLVNENSVNGIIYNCGIVGIVTNSSMIAPIAMINNGKILKTGVSFVNKTTTLTNLTSTGGVSGFVDQNDGVIYQSYSNLHLTDLVTTSQYLKKLVVTAEDNSNIKESYFGGVYNNNIVDSLIYTSSGITTTVKHTFADYSKYFFKDSATGGLLKTTWSFISKNTDPSINFGMPYINNGLKLYTTYTLVDNVYSYNTTTTSPYYIISSSIEFQNMKVGEKYFLSSNITVNGTYGESATSVFYGTIQGRGKVISGISLFYTLGGSKESVLNNITFKNINSTLAENSRYSVIATYLVKNAQLTNLSFEGCSVDKYGDKKIDSYYIGLLASEMENVKLDNISTVNSNTVTIKSYKINNSYKYETAGFIAGRIKNNESSTISNINYNKMNNGSSFVFKQDANIVGGLFGLVEGDTSVSITNADNNLVIYLKTGAIVTGTFTLGGIVGKTTTNLYLNNVNNKAEIASQSNEGTGGIVGYATQKLFLNNVNSTGNISGKNYIGGIAGQILGDVQFDGGVTKNLILTGLSKQGNYIGGLFGSVSNILGNGKSVTSNGNITIMGDDAIGILQVGAVAGNASLIKGYDLFRSNSVISLTYKYNTTIGAKLYLDDKFVITVATLGRDVNTTFNNNGPYLMPSIKEDYLKERNISAIIGNLPDIVLNSSTAKLLINSALVRYSAYVSNVFYWWKYFALWEADEYFRMECDVTVTAQSYLSYNYSMNWALSTSGSIHKTVNTTKHIDSGDVKSNSNSKVKTEWNKKMRSTEYTFSGLF